MRIVFHDPSLRYKYKQPKGIKSLLLMFTVFQRRCLSSILQFNIARNFFLTFGQQCQNLLTTLLMFRTSKKWNFCSNSVGKQRICFGNFYSEINSCLPLILLYSFRSERLLCIRDRSCFRTLHCQLPDFSCVHVYDIETIQRSVNLLYTSLRLAQLRVGVNCTKAKAYHIKLATQVTAKITN